MVNVKTLCACHELIELILCLAEGCSVNHNGTKVVLKEYGFRESEPDKEMDGMTPLMLAVQFLRSFDSYAMVNELMMSDNNTGEYH